MTCSNCIFNYCLTSRRRRYLEPSLIGDKDLFSDCSQKHGCWWLGCQGVITHRIDAILPKFSDWSKTSRGSYVIYAFCPMSVIYKSYIMKGFFFSFHCSFSTPLSPVKSAKGLQVGTLCRIKHVKLSNCNCPYIKSMCTKFCCALFCLCC